MYIFQNTEVRVTEQNASSSLVSCCIMAECAAAYVLLRYYVDRRQNTRQWKVVPMVNLCTINTTRTAEQMPGQVNIIPVSGSSIMSFVICALRTYCYYD
jgi:hypothetical protein